MTHLTDETMIEQIYGESENTAAVERHLGSCPECARNFAELKRDLAEMERTEIPLRDGQYGDRMWAAVAPLLPVYAPAPKQRWWWNFGILKGLSFATAGLLLAASAFYAGRVWQHKQEPTAAQVQPKTAPTAKQPIVVVVLDDHLDRSERFLVELKHADFDASAAGSPLRDEARSLLAANRVCRKNAAQSDDRELNTALDHLDKLLADAANEPGGMNAATISKLQDEMNAEGVLFEVRVLRSRTAHSGATASNSAEGGTI